MARDDARDLLAHILDRCAATGGPFWEATAEERARVTAVLGSPALAVRVGQHSEGDELIADTADIFLTTAIMAEIAIDLARRPHTGRTREEAIFSIREYVSRLLGDDPSTPP
ncbi:MAG: hypothetical protein K0S37_537 [Microbacterium sp.]|jgi:hypothetical protein|nr:hypothetical protein [Microbacterium sp.]